MEIHPVKKSDKDVLRQWANDPVTRGNSFHPHSIAPEEHGEWFENKLADINTVMLMAVNEGKKVGHIRFCLDGRQAQVHINVAPDERGKGYGAGMLKLAAQWLFEHHGTQRLIAHIKPDNLPSIKAFQKAGFRICDLVVFQGHQCFQLEYNNLSDRGGRMDSP